MPDTKFQYRVTSGWIRDLASQPTPTDTWPCIRWDDQLVEDQERFLDAQAELGVEYNSVWGLFVDREWPSPLTNVIDDHRAELVRGFADACHQRGLKLETGCGVYSWGFDQIIRKHPEVSADEANRHVMCPFREAAWEWQRRVLDYLMDERWGLDGISMQSADQGRCQCPKCKARSSAEHHADLITRCAQYVRAARPDWTIATACWGLSVHNPDDFPHIQHIAKHVDYLIEVSEQSAYGEVNQRPRITRELGCAFGSVGGVFAEPPQHWDRLRWFLPCGLGAARALRRLWDDGGRACTLYYRTFASPVEEVSWRVGARILSAPQTDPHDALKEALSAVYHVWGEAREQLADWFERAENAYFSRAKFKVGQGPISLEPLWWNENPATPGPPSYLIERTTPESRADYAAELRQLKAELPAIAVPAFDAIASTLLCIDGTLADIESLK